MEDSPRSSKRRKLDTPSRKTSSPLIKSTLRKASARLASRSTPQFNGEIPETDDEAASPSRQSRALKTVSSTPKNTSSISLRKRAIQDDSDLYDDIEGALPSTSSGSREPSPMPKPRASARKKSSQLPSSRNTPARSTRKNATTNQVADRGSVDDVDTNGYGQGVDLEAEIQDELAIEVSTPSRRKKQTATVEEPEDRITVEQTGTPLRTNGRKARSKPNDKDEAGSTLPKATGRRVTTPSSKSKAASKVGSNKRARSKLADEIQDDQSITIPDSEDDSGIRDSSQTTKPNKGRRRANYADNIGNSEEIIVTAEEDVMDEDVDVDGISIVGSALDPTEPSPFNRPSPATKVISQAKPASFHLDESLLSSRESSLLQSIVLQRISGTRPVPLIELEEEYKTVHQLVEHTITAGEGNSMLLIGARGSGKTALVNKVLSEISKDNGQDYHVVRLNGFIHTDDKIALREIWRQLGKEMDIEEDGGLGKNYADTLTTLLALLSHPSEQTGELTDQVAKAVVFVMDEFDLFASHPRQTLLYNLFDIAQSRKAPIAVLGLTTRIDATNSLEKRVKSRFSHRYVHLSLAKTFTTFQEICKASLIVQPDQLSVEERSILSASPVKTPGKKSRKSAKPEAKPDILAEWNSKIASLFASKSFLTNHLAPHYYRTKSAPAVLTSFLLPTATLSEQSTSIDPTTILSPPDSKLALISHLSTLALALIIAAARLDIIHDSDTCNFNMAYDEYVTLASKARIQSAAGGASASGVVSKVWGKEVARREWEDLVELGLVVPIVGGMTGGFGMVKCDVALEEIGAVLQGEKGVDKALERWCRQI